MKALAFYELAEWLFNNKKCPEGYRSSVSRAYYGALHVALEFLAEMGIYIPRGANPHEKVPDLLDHTGDSEVQKVGSMLNNLREERNNADYKIEKQQFETEAFASQRLKDASKIISVLSSCKLSKGTAGGRFEKARTETKRYADRLFSGI